MFDMYLTPLTKKFRRMLIQISHEKWLSSRVNNAPNKHDSSASRKPLRQAIDCAWEPTKTNSEPELTQEEKELCGII